MSLLVWVTPESKVDHGGRFQSLDMYVHFVHVKLEENGLYCRYLINHEPAII